VGATGSRSMRQLPRRESGLSHGSREQRPQPVAPVRPPSPVAETTVEALHRIRGALSPKELSDFTRQPLSNVGYHVRALSEHGAVELVETQPRRGSVEHFYKATPLVPATPWALASLGLSPSDK
jgi:DNA-binding transcriptional ArsR family regulator